MCGRYVNKNTKEEVIEFFGSEIELNEPNTLKPSYNICPTQLAPILRVASSGMKLENMHWGLIPSWSKDKKYASNLINARLETLNDKPSFKGLVKNHRCIVVASGYYEWVNTQNGKQPMYIHSNQSVLPLAGLWTRWGNVNSFTIVTQDSFSHLKTLHHRMPLILNNSSILTYLDESIEFKNSYKVSIDGIQYHKVSKIVNSVNYNNDACIKSID
ncbi:SOS response-associated peptidase [Candidatus Marinimicrobia bacterium]|nr:SOS response-associated peptidase [Candidatus Neomarinimicrobiota bacterium]